MTIDGTLVTIQMQDELTQAKTCVSQMVVLGQKLAKAEQLYRQEKHKRIAYERAVNNTPVSIIQDIVKGYEDIAELALKRDLAQVEYDANKEAELLHKKAADILRDIYVREYGDFDKCVHERTTT